MTTTCKKNLAWKKYEGNIVEAVEKKIYDDRSRKGINISW